MKATLDLSAAAWRHLRSILGAGGAQTGSLVADECATCREIVDELRRVGVATEEEER